MRALRRHLAEAFPGIGFTIENRDILIVQWTDGPSREVVRAIVRQHYANVYLSCVRLEKETQ